MSLDRMQPDRLDRYGLDALFKPETVALIGAADRAGGIGRRVLTNRLNPNFRGRVYAVNSRRSEVMGQGLQQYSRSFGTGASSSVGDAGRNNSGIDWRVYRPCSRMLFDLPYP